MLTLELKTVHCYHCGATLGHTDGQKLIGPSFDLNKAMSILCKCGAKRFWCPDKCGKIEVSERKEMA